MNEAVSETPELVNEDPYTVGLAREGHAQQPRRGRRAALRRGLPGAALLRRLTAPAVTRYTSATDADREQMLAEIGVVLRRRAVRRPARGRAARPPAGAARRHDRARGVRAAGRARRAQHERRGRDQLPRRGHVRPLRAGDRRLDHAALGVPHSVHALPARDLAGHAAGDVRVPDLDLRADRPAGLERGALRGPVVGGRGRVPGARRDRALEVPRLARACTRIHARRSRPTRPATERRSRRCRWRPARPTSPRSSARSTTTPPRCSSSSRTSSARSRTSRALAPVAKSTGALLVVAVDALTLGVLRPPGEFGADVAVGEGQPLGNRLDYGGPSVGLLRRARGAHPAHAGPHRGRDDRRRRAARLRAHAADARAAHPAREGDVEHLHEPAAERAGRRPST